MALFDFVKRTESENRVPLRLFNTLGRELQEFTLPATSKYVRMYNCGPTVYDRQHIGNLSMFVFTDILRKVLEYNGYAVKQTINITDFGHLTSDADEGDDKMLKGLKREKLKPSMENMKVLAEKYTNIFLEDLRALNVDVDPITFPRASEYVDAQIAMIKTLEEKGYAYKAEDGIYFDTAHFPAYGALGNLNLEEQKEGARVETKAQKHHPADFALWKLAPATRSRSKMGWDSHWGRGFPGWHIECSAMARATLGEQIDIHTGGIEHIGVHHNNEIAQSECATGKKPFSRFWLHRAHIQHEGGKLAKSQGHVVYLSDVEGRGFHPLALRYLFLGAHYRTPMNFTWDALSAAQTAFLKLVALREELKDLAPGEIPREYRQRFLERINDDLDTASALALMWEVLKDRSLSKETYLAAMLEFDKVFGLKLSEPDAKAKELLVAQTGVLTKTEDAPEHIRELLKHRDEARAAKDYAKADAIRAQIQDFGYTLEDSPEGPKLFKR